MCVYIYIDNWPIGIMVRVFGNSLEDQVSIPGQVIPKIKKIVLNASLLNTQHYKVQSRISGAIKRKRVAPSPTLQCCSYWKESLGVVLNYYQLTYLLYIYIHIHTHTHTYIYIERERKTDWYICTHKHIHI